MFFLQFYRQPNPLDFIFSYRKWKINYQTRNAESIKCAETGDFNGFCWFYVHLEYYIFITILSVIVWIFYDTPHSDLTNR